MPQRRADISLLLVRVLVGRFLGEILFCRAAERAGPAVGQIFKLCPCFNPVLGVALGRVIFVAAQLAYVVNHVCSPFALHRIAVYMIKHSAAFVKYYLTKTYFLLLFTIFSIVLILRAW